MIWALVFLGYCSSWASHDVHLIWLPQEVCERMLDANAVQGVEQFGHTRRFCAVRPAELIDANDECHWRPSRDDGDHGPF